MDIIFITEQQMQTTNKENLKNNCNALLETSNKSSKVAKDTLAMFHLQSDQQPEMMSEQLGLKIYQERRANRMLYDKIKGKFSFFEYELRAPLKSNEHCSVLIKEYDRLLAEREYLERQWMRLEYRFRTASKENGQNYNFLLDVWHPAKKNQARDSEETIDRINKAIVLMKQGVDACLTKQKDENCYYPLANLQNSSEYTRVCHQLQAERQKTKEIMTAYELALSTKDKELKELLTQNADLISKVQQLYTKNKKNHLDEVQLYEKLNKLTAQLLERDKKIEQLKFTRDSTKKYVSKEVDQANRPLFQIFIKARYGERRGNGLKKYEDCFAEKSLEEIQEFLRESDKEYLDNFQIVTDPQQRYSQPLEARTAVRAHADDSRPSLPTALEEVQNCRENQYLSSSKKPRKVRQLFSTAKSKECQVGGPEVKQMLFIRKK